jgi:hypothetical protein
MNNLSKLTPQPTPRTNRPCSLLRKIAFLLAVTIFAALVTSTRASAMTGAGTAGAGYFGIEHAQSVLDNRENAATILNYLHFGSDFKGYRYIESLNVVDNNGNTIYGQTALVYRYYWENDGDYTDVIFYCNQEGTIYGTRVRKTTAILNQPFLVANLSIQILGNALIESNKDSMTPNDLRIARELVKNADAQGLLNLWLRLQ